MQNNITRFLDSKKIPYTAFSLSAEKHSGLETAEILQVPPEVVYKSIVFQRERPGKYILAVVPSTGEVDPKKLARLLDEKKVQVVSQKEAERITGLQTGGISPLALINRGFQVVIDESAMALEYMHISGGDRSLNIRLAPSDLIRLVNAKSGGICAAADNSQV